METHSEEQCSPEIFWEHVAGLTIYARAVEGDEEPEIMLEWLFELMIVNGGDKTQLSLLAAKKLVQKLRKAILIATSEGGSHEGKMRESVFLGGNRGEISVYVARGTVALCLSPICGANATFEEFASLNADEAGQVAETLTAAVAAFK